MVPPSRHGFKTLWHPPRPASCAVDPDFMLMETHSNAGLCLRREHHLIAVEGASERGKELQGWSVQVGLSQT